MYYDNIMCAIDKSRILEDVKKYKIFLIEVALLHFLCCIFCIVDQFFIHSQC